MQVALQHKPQHFWNISCKMSCQILKIFRLLLKICVMSSISRCRKTRENLKIFEKKEFQFQIKKCWLQYRYLNWTLVSVPVWFPILKTCFGHTLHTWYNKTDSSQCSSSHNTLQRCFQHAKFGKNWINNIFKQRNESQDPEII